MEKITEDLKLQIIICGRKIDKNIVSLIIKEKKKLDFCSIDINNNEEFQLTTYDKLKWDFYELKDGFNDKIKEKIYDIIHKNFGVKEKYIESSLIFFTEDDEDDKDLLNFFDDKNAYFHPFIIFITNNKEKNKFYYENFIKENELDFDDRNIFVFNSNVTENRIIKENILTILWKNCCYYNGIGDDISFHGQELLGIKNELNEKYNNYLNFFIIGKNRSGKSALVNVICNEKKAKERIGSSSFSEKVIKYYVEDFPIALYDTSGFNSNEEIELTMKNIKNKMEQITDDKEQIHGIFYVMNQKSTRTLDDAEILLIKFILKYEIPLFILLNFANKNITKRNNYLESLFEVLENEFPESNISKHLYLINLKNDYEENTIFGLNTLFKDLYDYYLPHKISIDEFNNSFDDDLLNNILKTIKHSIFFRNITQLKDALKICREKAYKMIWFFLFLSFILAIPLPGVASVSTLEVILFSSILGIYVYKLNKIEIKNILKSFGASFVTATIGFCIGNSFLMVPEIGTFKGSIFKGSVASSATYAIGKLCIKYCEENFEKTKKIEFYKNLSLNYNNAIDNLKKISDNLD